MKKLAICIAVVCWATAQVHAAQWLTDLPKALSQAKAEKKDVLMEFTGSDWCPPCKALHKNVMTSPEFDNYAQKNLVLVEVDFPHAKQQTEELKKNNQALAEKYGIQGYPTVIVLDQDGQVLDKTTGYDGAAPQEFITHLEQLKKKESPVNYHP